ncbi:uncharacterized protein Z518_02282 [Rhinocladiella mackenziei CBS 650.93]|uniref:FAD-binding domain-containing protein n=1 Tax=Rhinocladiella mackenziei CBS 650.93 TaxID=1442369 RepID=A0A0D2IP51_9EURO|nr:uncharacterized protein Z518_02282 [Rhinocladiella mackenziei CBS 650.93]KIX07629.1 hypothetical protein Z518_02282 [Rhinocladiella mackenziei CBS 650.93]
MVDSLDLAKAIAGCGGDARQLPATIKRYEKDMLTRGEQFAQKSWKKLEGHFIAHAGEEMAQRVLGKK